ncbi:MAG: hypothetical protein WCQ53_04735 [bacterium]
MKKTIILLILFSLSSYAFAQTAKKTSTKKFLKAKSHYKAVAKDTQKLEKALSETGIKEPVQVDEAVMEEAPPVAEVVVVEPTPVKEEAPAPVFQEEHRGWLLTLKTDANLSILRVNDQFKRELKLGSNLGISGYSELGYRFGRHFALVADYSIDRVKFDNFGTYTVTQSSAYLMSGRLGPRFYLTNRFSIEVLAGLRQHYTGYATSTTKITVQKFDHGSVTLGFDYALVKAENFLLTGRTDLDFFLPVTVTGWKTNLGMGATTELRFGVPITEKNSFFLNIGGGYLNLKPTIATQYDIVGSAGVGFIHEN